MKASVFTEQCFTSEQRGHLDRSHLHDWIIGLAEAKAPWYGYLILVLIVAEILFVCGLAREKCQSQTKPIYRKSPPQPGICPADLRQMQAVSTAAMQPL